VLQALDATLIDDGGSKWVPRMVILMLLFEPDFARLTSRVARTISESSVAWIPPPPTLGRMQSVGSRAVLCTAFRDPIEYITLSSTEISSPDLAIPSSAACCIKDMQPYGVLTSLPTEQTTGSEGLPVLLVAHLGAQPGSQLGSPVSLSH